MGRSFPGGLISRALRNGQPGSSLRNTRRANSVSGTAPNSDRRMGERGPGTLQRHLRAPRGWHTARLPPSCNRSLAGSHDRRRQWSLPPAPCTRPPDRSHPSRPKEPARTSLSGSQVAGRSVRRPERPTGPRRTSLRARATRGSPRTARAILLMKSRTMGRATTGETGSRESSMRRR